MKDRQVEVGDVLKITDKNGESFKGTIIDFNKYPDGRVFLIQLPDGKEREVNESGIKRIRKKK